MEYTKPYLFIFCGALCYILASYAHLKMKNWSILNALLIAIPLVFIEYNFSLRGNKQLHALGKSSNYVLITTMSFYFICMQLVNKFYLLETITAKNFMSFVLILLAFYVSK